MNNTRRRVLYLAFFAISLLTFVATGTGVAQNQKPADADKKAVTASTHPAQSDYVGSDQCVDCHQDESKRLGHTVMGKAFAKPHSEAEKVGCESCHGPGKAHVEAGGTKETIAIRFSKDSTNTVAEKNASCLSCHSKGKQMFWRGSQHESRSLTCVGCHQGHPAAQERRLSADGRFSAPLTENQSVKKSQPELCLTCHQMRRAQLQRSSHMPYREGKVTCTSCHNPHGTPHPKQLLQATTNENCLSCHTERRGPFLWEHPPVVENCANCHEPHGSSNPQLLKTRMPRVCDSCHVTSRHPTQAQPLGSIKNFNRGCTNCHSQIHGSNHPSGNFFLR